MFDNNKLNFNCKVLAQSRPAGTGATLAYTGPANGAAIVRYILVANTTALAAAYSIYLDDDGTTYDQTTALFYAISLAANDTELIDIELPLTSSSANLAVQTGTGSAITFTVIGEEKKR